MEENNQLEKLTERIRKLEKINKALMSRVENSNTNRDGAFSLFEGNVLLKKRIAEKTQELELAKIELLKHNSIIETKLEEQKKTIQHSAKLAAIGELAAGIGHEINNPLTISNGSIMLLEAILRKGDLDGAKIQEKVDKIKNANERIINIVDGLRSFSRTDEDSQESFCVNKVITGTIDLLSEIYERDGTSLKVELLKQDVCVVGNIGKMQQILMNFLSNAKYATQECEQGKIVITLSKHDEQHIALSVKDNGTGMSQEVMGKVLEPFFTTKPNGSGTGIGLGLIAGFVNEMDGKIEISSQIGKGSTFTVILPLCSSTN